MIHILISPIRSVIHEIPDSDAWYILCFSARRELEPSPNARAFYFLDTTEESNPHRFKPIHAELIYEFFRSIPDGADLFVCCDAGESRSAAIAAALKVAQGESDAEIWNSPEYHPKPLVYRTCRETFFDPGI